MHTEDPGEDSVIEMPDLESIVDEMAYENVESADYEPPAHVSEDPLRVDHEFDPKHKLDFSGLLFIGKLTEEFVWMGHRFKIRTITTNEYLEVALLHRRYKDSIGDVRAYTSAIVAACLETVDGKSLPIALDRKSVESTVEYAFRYVIDHWYPWVIDAIYEKFRELEGRVESVMDEMGKVSA